MDKELVAICGDAVEELKKIPTNSIRLIITDPPYNLNKDYGKSKDNLEFEEYLKFSRKWLKEANRVLSKDGSIYVFMGMRYISYIYSILEQELGMTFNSWITWFYTQGIGKTKGFSPRHDDILYFTKSPKNFIFNLDEIRVPQKYYRSVNNMRGANPGNVWEFSHIHYCNKNRKLHPTQKPEALYERMILSSSNEGDIVLDPFLGSGTLLRVAQQTNRRATGFDSNPEYIVMCEERLKEPFHGFDSIDERMKRVPNDLNDPQIRLEYIKNHIKWFLKNHPDAIEEFIENVKVKYYSKLVETNQLDLIESLK
ncbi:MULTISPECIES: DNA-methyltransferase [Bacillati]|uniref:Methyltransferase n=1 Tax=Gardnerella vaginalis TaxID=2702 RepID=A0A135Z6C3_GARVA|nr:MULTISPECIES: site-specific DNA-methyltransferase [Terrabacteria group]KXI17186.1 DNA (cytosine-5-)-methyltransferase [Gardnerella vaginalis]WEG36998.1 site-specific DNA-methyltransferase [Amygdalobacter nucleatus]